MFMHIFCMSIFAFNWFEIEAYLTYTSDIQWSRIIRLDKCRFFITCNCIRYFDDYMLFEFIIKPHTLIYSIQRTEFIYCSSVYYCHSLISFYNLRMNKKLYCDYSALVKSRVNCLIQPCHNSDLHFVVNLIGAIRFEFFPIHQVYCISWIF